MATIQPRKRDSASLGQRPQRLCCSPTGYRDTRTVDLRLIEDGSSASVSSAAIMIIRRRSCIVRVFGLVNFLESEAMLWRFNVSYAFVRNLKMQKCTERMVDTEHVRSIIKYTKYPKRSRMFIRWNKFLSKLRSFLF